MSWFSSGYNALFGDKNTKQTTNEEGVDAFTKGQLGSIWNAAQQNAQGGPGQLLTGAGQYGTQLQGGGSLGIGALSGDPASIQKLMNPYQQQVIDANNAEWQHTNAQTLNQVNDAATQAGAFGGSRHGVAEGVALSNNNRAQQGQTANLLSQGYGQAVNQAGQLAGYGLAGSQLNAGLGFGGVGNGLWAQNALRGGFVQPTGMTGGSKTTEQGTPSIWGTIGNVAGTLGKFFA